MKFSRHSPDERVSKFQSGTFFAFSARLNGLETRTNPAVAVLRTAAISGALRLNRGRDIGILRHSNSYDVTSARRGETNCVAPSEDLTARHLGAIPAGISANRQLGVHIEFARLIHPGRSCAESTPRSDWRGPGTHERRSHCDRLAPRAQNPEDREPAQSHDDGGCGLVGRIIADEKPAKVFIDVGGRGRYRRAARRSRLRRR